MDHKHVFLNKYYSYNYTHYLMPLRSVQTMSIMCMCSSEGWCWNCWVFSLSCLNKWRYAFDARARAAREAGVTRGIQRAHIDLVWWCESHFSKTSTAILQLWASDRSLFLQFSREFARTQLHLCSWCVNINAPAFSAELSLYSSTLDRF